MLGIGFIMIAAIFPVAIMQTQATMEETIGTAVTRNGVSYLRGGILINKSKLPFTNNTIPAPATAGAPPNPGQVFSFYDPRIQPGTAPNNQAGPEQKPQPQELWNSIKGNLIVSDDPRFAFVPMYVRDGGSNFAKLIVVGVRVRQRDKFETGTNGDTERRSGACANLEPRPVKVTLIDGGTTAPDRAVIQVLDTGDAQLQALSNASNAVDAAVDGAYLIISNDNADDDANTPFQNEHGALNGRVYRLGPETSLPTPPPAGARQFELVAGEDMTRTPGPDGVLGNADDVTENMDDATAFIVGRGYAGTTGTNYGGPSMAVQRFENVIPLP